MSALKRGFIATKHKGRWAVYNMDTNVYAYYRGSKASSIKADELNAILRRKGELV